MAITVTDLKLIAILVISFGSTFFGLLPSLTGLGRRKDSLVLSSFLCFGGGILFATAVVHILPDIRQDLPQWSELILCIGFLSIYLLDVLVEIFSNTGDDHQENSSSPIGSRYGAINGDIISQESNFFEVRQPFKCTNFSLLFAFSIHSLLEGLVIGVEESQRGVILLLTAVCCHKLVVAFCLGSEICSDGRPLYAVIPPLSIFVFGSAFGIGLGILIRPENSNDAQILVPILQGLAGGTLLYVFVSEILPRERSRKLCQYAPLVQFLSVSVGFAVMAVLSELT